MKRCFFRFRLFRGAWSCFFPKPCLIRLQLCFLCSLPPYSLHCVLFPLLHSLCSFLRICFLFCVFRQLIRRLLIRLLSSRQKDSLYCNEALPNSILFFNNSLYNNTQLHYHFLLVRLSYLQGCHRRPEPLLKYRLLFFLLNGFLLFLCVDSVFHNMVSSHIIFNIPIIEKNKK